MPERGKTHAASSRSAHLRRGLHIPIDAEGVKACAPVVEGNAASAVTWVHSYVSWDRRLT